LFFIEHFHQLENILRFCSRSTSNFLTRTAWFIDLDLWPFNLTI